MYKKVLFALLSVLFLSVVACKKEGVSLVTAGLRDLPTSKQGDFKWVKGVNRGQVVKIVEDKDGEWMKVQLPDGITEGWIEKIYINKGKKQAVEFTDATRLFDQPDGASKVLANLPAGSRALVLSQKDKWSNVSIKWGMNGWVESGSYKESAESAAQPRVDVTIAGIGKCPLEASATLPDSAGYTFGVTNLFDKNPGTTWQVGNGGVGEWVEISFPEAVNVSVAMINGFAKIDPKFEKEGAGGDLYLLNNRVKSVKVEFWNEAGAVKNSTVQFEDEIRDYQDAGAYQGVTKIRFIINGIYKGQKWNDTALSEIKIERL